jgi:large subunit ribosomal protein L23
MINKVLVLKPRISEKAYGLSQVRNTYVFDVPKDANRSQVAAAVAEQFEVTVVGVNITVIKGKTKRSYRKGGRPTLGRRADNKKAYVRLAEGQSIPIFASEEESKAEEKPAKKEKK